MKKLYIFIVLFIVTSLIFTGIVFFVSDSEFFQNALLRKSHTQTIFLSPFKLLPYVSALEARNTICSTVKIALFKKICNKKYNNVSQNDVKKIDDLFLFLDRVKKDKKMSDYDRFLLSQLIFSTLPDGSAVTTQSSGYVSSFPFLSIMRASAQPLSTGMTRSEYEALLRRDFDTVRENCPQEGYENWVLTVMCSEHSWINGVKQPIYSKQYAEAGGPCMFSEAGAIEGYLTKSILDTKMKSEYSFQDSQGVSNDIACFFSCGSYQCPKMEKEIGSDLACKNPIYIPHTDLRRISQLSSQQQKLDLEEAASDCAERGYRYMTRADGTSERSKERDCRLRSDKAAVSVRQNPPVKTPIVVNSFCCDCKRPVNDPYVIQHDFTESGYKGSDLVGDLLKKREDDVESTPTPDETRTEDTQIFIPEEKAPQETVTTLPQLKTDVSTVQPETTSQTTTGLAPENPTPVVSVVPPPKQPQGITLQFRYTCEVKKTLSPPGPGGVPNPHYFDLVAKSQLIGDPGTLQNVKVSDQLGITGQCGSLRDEVPECIDPRTNKVSGELLDFTREFTNVTQADVIQVNYQVYDWLYKMDRGKRQCRPEDLPSS